MGHRYPWDSTQFISKVLDNIQNPGLVTILEHEKVDHIKHAFVIGGGLAPQKFLFVGRLTLHAW